MILTGTSGIDSDDDEPATILTGKENKKPATNGLQHPKCPICEGKHPGRCIDEKALKAHNGSARSSSSEP